MAVRRKRLQQSGDPISDLPEPIIGEILSLLPLKQAVRTSVLSKRWRRLWNHMTQLDLGFYKLNHNPTGWSKIVSSVLSSLRFSPIVSCHLAWPPFCEHNDIHRFLLILSQSNIQKLTITSRSPTIVIPQCLLNCTTITDLSLSACAFPPSHPSFHCWSKLKSLALYGISLPRDDNHTIHSLLSTCNLLQSLTMWECNGVRYLKICCPKLTYLRVYSYSALSVVLEGTSGLLKAHITLRTKFRQDDNWEANDLLQILKLPVSIESMCLNLGQDLIKHWPKVYAFKHTFSCFLNLKKLDISINMKDDNAVSLFACLLKSSPLLKELHVQMERFRQESTSEIDFWDKHCYYPCLNQHLRIAKIYLDPFDEQNISFVKYLLAGTSSLTMMHIVLEKEGKNEIFHLMKKASAQVDIKVENIRP